MRFSFVRKILSRLLLAVGIGSVALPGFANTCEYLQSIEIENALLYMIQNGVASLEHSGMPINEQSLASLQVHRELTGDLNMVYSVDGHFQSRLGADMILLTLDKGELSKPKISIDLTNEEIRLPDGTKAPEYSLCVVNLATEGRILAVPSGSEAVSQSELDSYLSLYLKNQLYYSNVTKGVQPSLSSVTRAVTNILLEQRGEHRLGEKSHR